MANSQQFIFYILLVVACTSIMDFSRAAAQSSSNPTDEEVVLNDAKESIKLSSVVLVCSRL